MLELLGPARAWGSAGKGGISEQSSTDTLEWQQLVQQCLGQMECPPTALVAVSAGGAERGEWGECV